MYIWGARTLKNNKKNLHDKHRERVRGEFLAHGFSDNTPVHKVLEMLLFYSIPRKDTNDIAHELINHFGSLENVLEASEQELRKIEGIGDNTVAFFKLLLYITRNYRSKKKLSEGKLKTIDDIYEFLYAKYIGLTKEVFGVGTFNSRGEFIGFDFIKEGDVSSVGISVRELMEIVLKRNATAVIIAHNHPGGTAVPSKDDIVLTEKIFSALSNINVDLLDHIIVVEDDYVSFRQTANLRYLFQK